jgi:chemotaxis protein MotA
MDIGTILGFLFGFGFISAAIMMHGSLTDFIDVPGAMVAFGGSTSALFIMFPMKKVLGVFGVVKNCFLFKLPNPKEEISRLTDLATVARRDGLLALEKRVPELNDPFLKRGLEMVIDGTPKEKIEEVLNIELQYIQERHTTGKKIFDQLGASLPAFGMVGTLIGLIQMLHELDDPTKIGAGKEETLLRELMIQGLAALVEGEAPRAIETKLKAFLAPKAREGEVQPAAAA